MALEKWTVTTTDSEEQTEIINSHIAAMLKRRVSTVIRRQITETRVFVFAIIATSIITIIFIINVTIIIDTIEVIIVVVTIKVIQREKKIRAYTLRRVFLLPECVSCFILRSITLKWRVEISLEILTVGNRVSKLWIFTRVEIFCGAGVVVGYFLSHSYS
ncbi:hypothetical protein HELRODRAFT_163842 [Helobdella robusta]|uniref:Uncharacterized protein n=1 Tax=Helobdella robusta TaxID=6412 RepID=T1EUJ3_HELRO|nr:hypothetical protein HELRODRAFT_163842 [Helobdella robusta]ESN96738.1 hypothetical protein HELRODRAFT_163842 [Helobdella robusta]